MTATPPILGVAEIVLSVRDLPAMREFYQRVMGFPLHSEFCLEDEVDTATGEPTISFLKMADTNTPLGRDQHPQLLALIDYQRHANARPRFDGHDVRRSTLNHLAFEIPPESYDAHRSRLKDLGLNPVFSEFDGMNARAMFFKDPEGNVLELICQHAFD